MRVVCARAVLIMRMRRMHMQPQKIAILLRKNQHKVKPKRTFGSLAIDSQRGREKMADRDNNVYLAKLAEQAERYDGKEIQIVSMA